MEKCIWTSNMEENFKWNECFKLTPSCNEARFRMEPNNYIYCPYCGKILEIVYQTDLHKIPEYADIFVIKELGEDLTQWPFGDDAGHGYLATDTQESNIQIEASMFLLKNVPEWATHITWYNK